MHKIARPLSNAHIYFEPYLSAWRVIGHQHRINRRNFHGSHSQRKPSSSLDEVPSKPSIPSDTTNTENPVAPTDWAKFEKALDHGKTLLSDADKEWPGITTVSDASIPAALRESWKKRSEKRAGLGHRHHGSWRNRAARHAREDDDNIPLPKVTRWKSNEHSASESHIPQWFLDRNVLLQSDIPETTDLVFTDPENVASSKRDNDQHNTKLNGKPNTKDSLDLGSTAQKKEPVDPDNDAKPSIPSNGPRYQIGHGLFSEIEALARAGMQSATSKKPEDTSVSKPHILLQSPKTGGNLFLSCVAQKIVKSLGADCILLDPATISELVLDTGIELPEKLSDAFKLLGYDVHQLDLDLEAEEEEEDFGDEARDGASDFKPFQSVIDNILRRGSHSSSASAGKPAYKVNVLVPKMLGQSGISEAFSSSWSTPSAMSHDSRGDITESDLKYTLFMDHFLDAALVKGSPEGIDELALTENRKPLVLVIQDYLELQTTKSGGIVLDKIHELVQDRRTMGQQVLIIGLSSSEDLFPASSVEGMQKMQITPNHGPCRTIITIPSAQYETIFEQDERKRTMLLNIRNLQDMLRRLAWNKEVLGEWCWKPAAEISLVPFADASNPERSPFDLTVWSAHRINRIATLALGFVTEKRHQVDEELAAEALHTSLNVDVDKFNFFAGNEKAQTQKDAGPDTGPKSDSQNMLAKIRKTANSHEKKLLHGVIDKKDIKTTFSSVHAPDSAIKSLKTLTSLSLQRPDAFGYGVLANDKIPGLLLYGPPGTGKTLLAKAVAGESGATVLEVSGSDIYDMYVGEGEKNVRAVFTLAEKLSPCVVFLDEADAILGSRSTPGNRTTHRELINQFLREWDGLSSKNSSAFIMVATNRPFDLDDAVLRRLPRRLLIDLPTEKDREAILKIHLTGEQVEESVSIESLARRTPFYSGSDLKNVCVAAALQAVQEEYDAKVAFESEQAGKATPEKHSYPPVRTLTSAHFEKALDDISASISEDMSSLAAIRKFDEKYGDHRSRNKKGGLGFGTRSTADAERERREDGRVRREVLVGA